MNYREELEKLLEKSYSPYSHYAVSSIVVMKDGHSFTGVNIENASYGATVCAERVAILKAVSEGYRKGDFAEIHVMTSGNTLASSCFLCRQVITEFMDMDNPVILYAKTGSQEEYKVRDLCPYPFTGDDLA